MSAAQHQGVYSAHVGIQQLVERLLHDGGVHQSLFNQGNQLGSGDFIDLTGRGTALEQPVEFFFPQGDGGCHYANASAGVAIRCQLQRRLYPHHNQVGICCPQGDNGGSGGGVAGHHQCLETIGHQVGSGIHGQRLHLCVTADAVGSMAESP